MTKSGKSTDSFTYLGRSYRFFAEIRRAQARASSHHPPGEKPHPLAALSHKKPGIHTKWIPGRNHLQPVCARGADLQRCRLCARALLEVLDAALNQRLELVTGSELRDVLVEACTGALRVAHLAQDTTIGAGNALDS